MVPNLEMKEQKRQRVQIVNPALLQWDESQRSVIDAPAGDRLLVGAGPGTGKTAVACARVSHLIDQAGLEPSRVWLISFTRTAVREIRERIATHLEDAAAAYAVKIATLDSHAWTIHSGFDGGARILGDYEENIGEVLALLRSNEDVSDYLYHNVEHFVVDEGQDIVGVRADLIVEMIRRLSPSCGVSVFADDAQAIYGFADDHEVRDGHASEPTLPERIRHGAAGAFRECELVSVHRTHSPELLKIFRDVRRKVLADASGFPDKLSEVTDEIINLAHGKAPNIGAAFPREIEHTFILYRRRAEVLLAASMLASAGVPHRVRMSGLPVCLVPWIGAVLFDQTEPDLSYGRFTQLWNERVRATSLATCRSDEAWAHLVRIAGRTQSNVEMRLLRQRLGRKQPPAELCQSELGHRGPIVGTIHASKGRETDTVHLMLPDLGNRNVDQDEEARVVFVGATRGRSRLLVGRAFRHFATRVEGSGRAYSLHTNKGQPRAQFEVGRDSDIEAEGLAGRCFFQDTAAARAAQERIRGLAEEGVSLVAESDRGVGFAYRLKEMGQGQSLAVLSRAVNADLFHIAKAIQTKLGGAVRRPPDTIRHLQVRGVRTVVLPPDAPECQTLHEPWRSGGILLAPIILGYSTAFFPCARGRGGR